MNRKGTISLLQIFILVIGIFAFGYMIGGVEVVSGVTIAQCESVGKCRNNCLNDEDGEATCDNGQTCCVKPAPSTTTTNREKTDPYFQGFLAGAGGHPV